MVKTVRLSDDRHEKLKEIQEEAEFKPQFKTLLNRAVDDLYEKKIGGNDES